MSSTEYVAVVGNIIIRCDKQASYFTLEKIGGDTVLIFKNQINDLIKEIEKLKDLTDKPQGAKP